jgi:hypothetical protein
VEQQKRCMICHVVTEEWRGVGGRWIFTCMFPVTRLLASLCKWDIKAVVNSLLVVGFGFIAG